MFRKIFCNFSFNEEKGNRSENDEKYSVEWFELCHIFNFSSLRNCHKFEKRHVINISEWILKLLNGSNFVTFCMLMHIFSRGLPPFVTNFISSLYILFENRKGKIEERACFEGYRHVGDKLMLVTLCWWQFLDVGDNFWMLVTFFRSWWQPNRSPTSRYDVGDRFWMLVTLNASWWRFLYVGANYGQKNL